MIDTDNSLHSLAEAISVRSLPPVHDWHPAITRDVDMRIARNGDWFYQGSRINRPRMVKLFSTVLRMDGDETFLVTPAERLRIRVEDAPFTAVLVERRELPAGSALIFTTNVGDQVIADEDHPITVRSFEPDGEPSPYVLVRDSLTALINRPTYYQLADWCEERNGILGVMSCGSFLPLQDCTGDA